MSVFPLVGENAEARLKLKAKASVTSPSMTLTLQSDPKGISYITCFPIIFCKLVIKKGLLFFAWKKNGFL